MTAESTIEQLQARGWEQWQAWRATHLEITKESDETAWWTSMGRIASDLTPNDDATIIQLGLSAPIWNMTALDQPRESVRGTMREAIEQAITVHIQQQSEKAMTPDDLLEAVEVIWYAWRREHPDMDLASDEAGNAKAILDEPLIPVDDAALKALALDYRVWLCEHGYSGGSARGSRVRTVVDSYGARSGTQRRRQGRCSVTAPLDEAGRRREEEADVYADAFLNPDEPEDERRVRTPLLARRVTLARRSRRMTREEVEQRVEAVRRGDSDENHPEWILPFH